MSGKNTEGTEPIEGFKGLRNTVPSESFEVGDLEAAPNVDLNDAGDIMRRKGNSVVKLAGSWHSVFASGGTCVGVQGATLYRINADYSTLALRTDMALNRYVSYSAIAGRIYYSNGAQNGIIENSVNRTFGIDIPGTPSAGPFPGHLPAGRYQYVFTYTRSDGQESGAGLAGVIDVAANGGFILTNLPVSSDPTVVLKTLYLTKANSDALLRYATYPASAASALVVDDKPTSVALRTQFLGPPPAGDIVVHYRSYVLVAHGRMLYPSEPYAPELFDPRKGIPFETRITLVACMTDGIYLGSEDQIVWVQGDTPEKFTYNAKADYGVIPGTLAFGSMSQVGKGDRGEMVSFWMSQRGICMGLDGGEFKNLTEARFSYPVGDRGAGIVRRHQGMNQYIGVMHGVAAAGNRFT